MPTKDIAVQCKVVQSFRVKQVEGLFDVPVDERSSRQWRVELPSLDEPWKIGCIVGASGAGKSVIAREYYGDDLIEGFTWPRDKSFLDAFPKEMSIRTITDVLNSVGFSSPPDWVKPYRVLSNGQKFRADLARALLRPSGVVAFDEFTSVVDRVVAQFASEAVGKTVRAGRNEGGADRFVAVTCHHDVLPWLQPDWVLDLSCGTGGKLARGWLQRERRAHRSIVGAQPKIELRICHAHRAAWSLFREHHYLSAKINSNARCYMAWWGDRPVAFAATIHNIGWTGRRRIHRIVVLPDYQGAGVGRALIDAVAALEGQRHKISVMTSHPGLIHALQASRHWRCAVFAPTGKVHRTKGFANKSQSHGRSVVSFVWTGAQASAES